MTPRQNLLGILERKEFFRPAVLCPARGEDPVPFFVPRQRDRGVRRVIAAVVRAAERRPGSTVPWGGTKLTALRAAGKAVILTALHGAGGFAAGTKRAGPSVPSESSVATPCPAALPALG